jgi:hypothetical protein
MNSPTHRDNIVNTKYQEIGIAVVNGVLNGVKTTLVVQHFGTPLSAPVAVKKEPVASTPEIVVAPAVIDTTQSLGTSAVSSPSISPLLISKILGIIIFSLIIITMAVDSYLTLKNNTPRLTGSSASHIGFLAIILLLLIFGQQGSIF